MCAGRKKEGEASSGAGKGTEGGRAAGKMQQGCRERSRVFIGFPSLHGQHLTRVGSLTLARDRRHQGLNVQGPRLFVSK